ncbi:MAG: hypothetical protein AB7L13_01715 [Acidimicrobiia bacterium]
MTTYQHNHTDLGFMDYTDDSCMDFVHTITSPRDIASGLLAKGILSPRDAQSGLPTGD